MTHQGNRDIQVSRRTLLRGAAGLGMAAAAGPLLAACGSGGGSENAVSAAGAQAAGAQAAGTQPALETKSIRVLSVPPATCFAALGVSEPFLREQGFTDVQYKPFPAKEAFGKLAAGEADVGMGYAAAF